VRGIILAGGSGSRMRPATEAVCKSALLVYDKPMIHYPLTTLAEMGCDSAVVVASPSGVGDIAQMIKDGSDYSLDVMYAVQNQPGGVAQALGRAERSMKGQGVFPLVLGDCYYDPAPPTQTEPTLFWTDYFNAHAHSVWHPESGMIIEKPRELRDIGTRAIISYFYDEQVFNYIRGMKPAHNSGELEIVDIHNFYRNLGAPIVEFTGWFGDMGAPEGIVRVAQHLHEKTQLAQARQ
jgi:glucose-1-phosphate thymidylyltransferase